MRKTLRRRGVVDEADRQQTVKKRYIIFAGMTPPYLPPPTHLPITPPFPKIIHPSRPQLNSVFYGGQHLVLSGDPWVGLSPSLFSSSTYFSSIKPSCSNAYSQPSSTYFSSIKPSCSNAYSLSSSTYFSSIKPSCSNAYSLSSSTYFSSIKPSCSNAYSLSSSTYFSSIKPSCSNAYSLSSSTYFSSIKPSCSNAYSLSSSSSSSFSRKFSSSSLKSMTNI
ncbi:uncharacterized protein [Palaemon carinicauda]|uniref:uncharacterized protein n=1 Tax=Palaemon carinicauda TaxID=392227 RepID=UPI0035B6A9E8